MRMLLTFKVSTPHLLLKAWRRKVPTFSGPVVHKHLTQPPIESRALGIPFVLWSVKQYVQPEGAHIFCWRNNTVPITLTGCAA